MAHKDIDEEIREETTPVLLELGKALNTCQTFEYSLCLLLSLASEDQEPSGGGRFQATWDFHSAKVLGYLVGAVKKHLDIPDEYEEYLREGVEARNEIVHRVMNRQENIRRYFDPAGRLELIRHINELREIVKLRDKSVQPLIDDILKKYGWSVEKAKAEAEKLWEFNTYGSREGSEH